MTPVAAASYRNVAASRTGALYDGDVGRRHFELLVDVDASEISRVRKAYVRRDEHVISSGASVKRRAKIRRRAEPGAAGRLSATKRQRRRSCSPGQRAMQRSRRARAPPTAAIATMPSPAVERHFAQISHGIGRDVRRRRHQEKWAECPSRAAGAGSTSAPPPAGDRQTRRRVDASLGASSPASTTAAF